jgi:hypothetical protein
MKDATTPKLLFAVVVFAAIAFAVWTGMAATVETPKQAAHGGAYTTPF